MPQVKSTSKILKLYPFLFQGVLCVGGRLAHANLPDESKYQRLVPKESRLATLVIKKAHLDTRRPQSSDGSDQIKFLETQQP